MGKNRNTYKVLVGKPEGWARIKDDGLERTINFLFNWVLRK
jgi:hypothetical protein